MATVTLPSTLPMLSRDSIAKKEKPVVRNVFTDKDLKISKDNLKVSFYSRVGDQELARPRFSP